MSLARSVKLEPVQLVIHNSQKKGLGIYDKAVVYHQLSNFVVKSSVNLKIQSSTSSDTFGQSSYTMMLFFILCIFFQVFPSSKVFSCVFILDKNLLKLLMVERAIQMQLGEDRTRVWLNLGKFNKKVIMI